MSMTDGKLYCTASSSKTVKGFNQLSQLFKMWLCSLLAGFALMLGSLASAAPLSCGPIYSSTYTGGVTVATSPNLYSITTTGVPLATLAGTTTAPALIGIGQATNTSVYFNTDFTFTGPINRFDGVTTTGYATTWVTMNSGQGGAFDGNVYYVGGGPLAGQGNNLYQVSPLGAITALGLLTPLDPADTIFANLGVGDVAADANGRLYWYASLGGTGLSYLYEIDIATLKVRNLGNYGPNGATGAAFDTLGNLITSTVTFAAPYTSTLYSINLATGVATVVGGAGATVTGLPVNQQVLDLASCNFPTLNPNLTLTKTVANITVPSATTALPGNTLEYTMTITNTGNLAADLTKLSDAIPTGTTYVAGSTTMGGPLPAVPVAVADTVVGNKMPFDPSSGASGLVNTTGQPAGVVLAGAGNAVVVKFRVTVNATAPLPASISNTATANYTNVNTGVTTTLNATALVKMSIPDFGDAPDAGVGVAAGNYRTTTTDNGPRHIIVAGLNLGTTPPDSDTGLLQGAGATADDLSGVPDDEDAFVTLPSLSTAATTYALTVPLNNSLAVPATATLYGWLDINKNGRFDGNEAATASVLSGATSAVLTWAVTGQTIGTTYARFRLTTDVLTNANAATPTLEDSRSFGAAAASNGEVEDYQLTIGTLDYGDAPDMSPGTGVGNYRTTASDSGPTQTVLAALKLGALAPDADSGTLQDIGATADNLTGTNDEDAFATLPTLSTAATTYSLVVPLSNTSGAAATLYGWIDVNLDGKFDGNEAATVAVANGATTATLNWTGLTGIVAGQSYARFRLSSTALTNANAGNLTLEDTRSFGAGGNGEVEDYPLTNTLAGVNVSGKVYSDLNANGTADSGESWTGAPTVYAKLATLSAGNCVAPALSVQTLTAPTGAYTLTGVSAGTYCIILSANNLATDVTSSVPAGWLNILPANGILNLTVASSNVANQNFGLFNGSRLSGRVFKDTGNGGGTANDGVQNGAETGINAVTVTANQAGCAGTICATAATNANGDYVMWLPASVTGALSITESNPTGYISTGGQVGNTGGTYTFATDTTLFNVTLGGSYTNVNFADVPSNQFLTDGAQSALPGSTVVYPHSFIAGTAGNVAFAMSQQPSPALNTWSEVLYVDANCNAQLDAGEVVVPATTSVIAGQTVCLLVKEFVPAAAPLNAQNALTLTATFTSTFSGTAVSYNYVRHDTTTVGQPTGSGLILVKSVDVATALPGGNITYTITYTNNSSGILSNVVINDVTPSYTIYQSANCGVLPLNLTACAIAAPAVGATGAISYTMTGTLAPTSSGAVTFTVQVAP